MRYAPHFVSLELRFSLQLLLADSSLFCFLLLLQQKGSPLLGQFVFGLLLILNCSKIRQYICQHCGNELTARRPYNIQNYSENNLVYLMLAYINEKPTIL